MAAVSGKMTRGTSGGIGGSSNRAEPGMWSYAVPMNEESSSVGAELDETSKIEDQQRQPLSNHVNDVARPPSVKKTKSAQDLDSAYAASESGNNSHPDMQRIGREKAKSVSRDKSRSRVRTKGSMNALAALENLDNVVLEMKQVDQPSEWIHRDKLAAIESRELAEMGFRLSARPSRTGSQVGKKSSKNSSVDLGEDYQHENVDYERDVYEERKYGYGTHSQFPDSPIKEEADEAEEYSSLRDDGFSDQPVQPQTYQRQRKPSQSKIPVSKPSSSAGEPGSPATNSGEDTHTGAAGSTFGFQTHRARSSSASSAKMLEQAQRKGSTSGVETANKALQNVQTDGSPSKKGTVPGQLRSARSATKMSPDQSRPRTSGSSSSGGTKRPGSGNEAKAPVSRPEGDPPWLDNMYKPDPRLPPDQQMLPTVARRLAQEKAEKERLQREEVERKRRAAAEAERQFSDIGRRAADEQIQQNSEFTLLDAEDSGQSEIESHRKGSTTSSQRSGADRRKPPSEHSSLRQQVDTVASHEQQQHRYQQQQQMKDPRQNGEWPLRTPSPTDEHHTVISTKSLSPTKERSDTPDMKGYNIMPVIHTQQELEQRTASRTGQSFPTAVRTGSNTPTPAASSPLVGHVAKQTKRLPVAPDMDEKEERKKEGCACCVVM